MTNRSKFYRHLWFILFVFLVACGQQPTASLTKIYIVVPRDTSTPIPLPTFPPHLLEVPPPSPLPTQPPIPIITPDAIQVERWREYQIELAKSLIYFLPPEETFCEWDILGQSGQEVYVWAVCGSSKGDDSRPAIIHIEPDGSVNNAEILERGSSDADIDRMFPKEAQAKFIFYTGNSIFNGRRREMYDHLIYRETHPEEPPLNVLSAIMTTIATTPSPPPTQPAVPLITPDAIQVERWREYQTELARVILAANPEIGNDSTIYKNALCEWDILGHSGQEVYVYGVCVGVTTKGNRDMRKPAIIYLEPDGSIQKVKIPEPKESNREMFNYNPFPKDVQEKFCYYFDPFPSDLPQCPYPYLSGSPRPRIDEMYAHIEYRKAHPEEPPLIVLSAIPTP